MSPIRLSSADRADPPQAWRSSIAMPLLCSPIEHVMGTTLGVRGITRLPQRRLARKPAIAMTCDDVRNADRPPGTNETKMRLEAPQIVQISLLRERFRSSDWWSGTGSNCRPSAFQEVYHPESAYLEKVPTAQLTHIGAADRLFSVPLTRITSVPECAVSSVGFLWGSAAVSLSCGVSVGVRRSP
jgi:hypothetical protein